MGSGDILANTREYSGTRRNIKGSQAGVETITK